MRGTSVRSIEKLRVCFFLVLEKQKKKATAVAAVTAAATAAVVVAVAAADFSLGRSLPRKSTSTSPALRLAHIPQPPLGGVPPRSSRQEKALGGGNGDLRSG